MKTQARETRQLLTERLIASGIRSTDLFLQRLPEQSCVQEICFAIQNVSKHNLSENANTPIRGVIFRCFIDYETLFKM